MTRFRALFLLSVVLGCLTLASAQGTYTQVDIPGALSTRITGINTAGDMVGTYTVPNLVHGFLMKGGIVTTVDYPGSNHNNLQGINDNGQIVGSALPYGFHYDIATQTFTSSKYPQAKFTYAMAINNSGIIAGYALTLSGNTGFEFVNGSFRAIAYPGASGTIVDGISDSNELSGYASVSGSNQNFVFRNGNYQPITIPGSTSAIVTGINWSSTALVGFDDTLPQGFFYQPIQNLLRTIAFPGARDTQALGVNSSGTVVGDFVDSNGMVHGFVFTPGQ